MKRNRRFFPVVLVILAGLVLAAVFSCNVGGNSGGGGTNVTIDPDIYTGKDTDGKEYELIVTGADYVFKIDGKSISTGAVSKNGNLWTLMPNGADGPESADFDVTITGEYIAEIGGVIYPDGVNTKPITPGEMVPAVPLELVWDWYTIDDADTNEKLGSKQSIYPPGGASRITNAVDVTNDDGTKGKKPYEYPEETKPKDKDGNPIAGPVYNFTGNTKTHVPDRTSNANAGAQFPLVGWEAKPADNATLAQLRKARGYSFWVRLNSSTASNWSFLTAVETDFPPNLGYEYKHYYGNKPGDSGGKSGIDNFTGSLNVGTWYKITVIMANNGFNLFQDAWIWKYDSGKDARGDFHQNKAQKLQWQIPLQHQDGAGVSARNGDPYDIIKGSYDFNLDFYGLELIMK